MLKHYTGTHCKSRKSQGFIFAQIYYTYHTYDFNASYASFWTFFQHNALLMYFIDTLLMHMFICLFCLYKDRNRVIILKNLIFDATSAKKFYATIIISYIFIFIILKLSHRNYSNFNPCCSVVFVINDDHYLMLLFW